MLELKWPLGLSASSGVETKQAISSETKPGIRREGAAAGEDGMFKAKSCALLRLLLYLNNEAYHLVGLFRS